MTDVGITASVRNKTHKRDGKRRHTKSCPFRDSFFAGVTIRQSRYNRSMSF